MPTDFFLRSGASGLGGAGQRALSQRRGRVSSNVVTTTTAGGTNIQVTATAGGQELTWFSEPFTADIAISGTVTVNIRALESAVDVNAGRGILIERTDNAGAVQSSIVADTTVPNPIMEMSTIDAANAAATYTPTSTAMSAGDRIKVTLKVRNVGTMGAGTVTISHDGPTTAGGSTWVRFTEDIFTDEVLDVPHYQIIGSGYRG
jgi:hypothetical protein